MSWRICRILDFQKSCSSVHAQEEIAKIETAGALAAMASRFHSDLPKYAGVWGYPKNHPGFVEGLELMLESVGLLLEDQEVWAAYDEWHTFMNQWEGVLPLPLWAQVGTVIVDGPGPTVEPASRPSKGLEPASQKDLAWEVMKSLNLMWKTIAREIHEALHTVGRPEKIVNILFTVELIANEMDPAVKSPDMVEHWTHLVRQETARRYGLLQ